ncbi:MAG: NRAMP family divalent metal transporter [Ktedonobacterales bacterium]
MLKISATTSAQIKGPVVLDDAHVGDIHGAWGTIRREDSAPRRNWIAALLALLVIMGPGLITMVGDNDAGGVATYAQAGQNYGTTLLWTLLLLIPVLIVNQEMVVRLGAVTGVGHARLIFERFGKFWGAFSVGDLFLLNFLTLVTEFIGFSLALGYFGVSPLISVPLGVAGLVAITVTGSFRRWESAMWICIVASLLIIPLVFLTHPQVGPVVHDTVVPSVAGGLNGTALLLIIAIVGTTVAPWQLFFQQSNVIDKRITPRWLNYERADTMVGALVVTAAAAGLIMASAFAFAHTSYAGQFADAGVEAVMLTHRVGRAAGVIFALVLLNASIIGACAVTLSSSYAFGDVFRVKHSLHRSWRDAKFFYSTFAGMLVLAGTVVLIPGAPLGLITTAVQALAGILLPSATVFLLLLCNDRAVLGPWTNRPWLNVVGSAIVGVLVMLSLILAATTFFPNLNANLLLLVLGGILVAALLGMGVATLVQHRLHGPDTDLLELRRLDKGTWRMPPLAELTRPVWSTTAKVGMLTLRLYLVAAVILMVVKVIQLALGGH